LAPTIDCCFALKPAGALSAHHDKTVEDHAWPKKEPNKVQSRLPPMSGKEVGTGRTGMTSGEKRKPAL